MKGIVLLLAVATPLVIACGAPAPAASFAPTTGLWSPIPAPAESTVGGADWIAIPTPGGRIVRAAVFRPTGGGPFPVILVLHGSSGFRTLHVQFAKDLAAQGFVTVAACMYSGNYPVTPADRTPQPTTLPDGIPCPEGPAFVSNMSQAAVADVQAIISAVRTLPGVRSERVGLYGHSRGGVVALTVAAATPAVGAVVAAAGYPYPNTILGLSAPVLMLQGTKDVFFPNDAREAHLWETAMHLAGKSVESRYFEDAPHELIFRTPWHDDALKLASTFLNKRLGG